MKKLALTQVSILLATVLAPELSAQSACPRWESGFESQDLWGYASDMIVHDDGSGSSLFVAGQFLSAGPQLASNVARWDGTAWHALGAGTDGGVAALARFDGGSGVELYAGGSFANAGGAAANHIAAWNGTSWHALGAGLDGNVNALYVWDNGSGPALYVGGSFTHAGGIATRGIARWKNGVWSDVAGGVQGGLHVVLSLTSFDDGSGSRLIVGGDFSGVAGNPANGIASFDGASWATLGAGLTQVCCTSGVQSLAVFDEGSGPRLFAGGSDLSTTTFPWQALMRWDGAAWTSVPFSSATYDFAQFNRLMVFDDGTGPALWGAGIFQQVPGVGLTNFVRWDGSSWSTTPQRLGWYAYAIARFDDGLGGGTKTYLAGAYELSATPGPKRIGRLDGATWSALDPAANEVQTPLVASAVFDDGSGASLFVAGGQLRNAGGVSVHGVARWTGSAWSAAGTEIEQVRTLEVLDVGAGRELYAGTLQSGTVAHVLWRWNGAQWIPLPGNFATVGDLFVDALVAFDDGHGLSLFAGGRFTSINGSSVNRIARFDGASWHPLAGGLNDNVYALAVFDDGRGPNLFAGGLFTSASGAPGTSRIARWNGSAWSSLAGGLESFGSSRVFALHAFDDGSGPALYVGGRFAQAGGFPANSIARWNGGGWSAVGAGMNGDVLDFVTHDGGDGFGARLLASGTFLSAGGSPANRLAAWDGSAWSRLENGGFDGADGVISTLSTFADGVSPGASLYVGGGFGRTGDKPAINFGKRSSCDALGEVFCAGDGSATTCPCGNTAATGHGCTNSTGRGGTLSASGQASLSSDSLVLRGENMTPSSACLYFQGSAATNGGLGTTFGDGLRCAGGTLVRLGLTTNSSGQSQFPVSGGASVSTLGHPPVGAARTYQAWYRDVAAFCTSSTFNLSNGLRIVWTE